MLVSSLEIDRVALSFGIVLVVCNRLVNVRSVQTSDDEVSIRMQEERQATPHRLPHLRVVWSSHAMQLCTVHCNEI